MKSKVSKSEIDLMVKLYKKGLSAAAICKFLPYTPHTIIDHLRERNVIIRNKGGYNPFNENYFENIDTENKAYFLGFLMADGCITERKNSQKCISIQLKSDDEYILRKFKSELKTKNKIGYNEKRNHSQLKIHSNKMANDLFKYGIIPRKTGFECFPKDLIPEDLRCHFIRGFFDGDGWATLTKSHGIKNKRISIGFVSNINMLTDIRDYFIEVLKNITDLKIHEYNDNKKGYIGFSSIIFSKFDNVKEIYDFMYNNATVYLKRKKKVIERALKLIPSRRRIGRPRNA